MFGTSSSIRLGWCVLRRLATGYSVVEPSMLSGSLLACRIRTRRAFWNSNRMFCSPEPWASSIAVMMGDQPGLPGRWMRQRSRNGFGVGIGGERSEMVLHGVTMCLVNRLRMNSVSGARHCLDRGKSRSEPGIHHPFFASSVACQG